MTMKRNHAPSPVVKQSSKKLLAFGWYGGKFSHLDWLLRLLPKLITTANRLGVGCGVVKS